MKNESPRRIAVIDSETDPFDGVTAVKPFAWGFYDGDSFRHFWGKDWIDTTRQLVEYLQSIEEPMLIYAHNGGKFDVFFLFDYLEESLRIVNKRVLQCFIGIHELRDSYAAVPVPLRGYKKDDFDYANMHKDRRDRYKGEILTYLQNDCIYLHELITAFHSEFGPRLTIGGTAMHELKKFHSFKIGRKLFDERVRPFYFGGRNQCFKSGIIQGDFTIYDVNSMYPFVMRNARHPVSTKNTLTRKIGPKTCFACVEAVNMGALPVRTKTGIDFTQETGEFFASIHEIEAGLETGTLKIKRVKFALDFDQTASFAEFVDHFVAKKIHAEKSGDMTGRLFYKLILNSAYGKFAQNPENYKDHILTRNEYPGPPWQISESNGEFKIWEKDAPIKSYYNVATAASITGAARALLLRGLALASDPIYCDTDSIICQKFGGKIHPTELGAWKVEGHGDQVAIAGKKLYAVFDDLSCIKQASKGCTLTPEQLTMIAKGQKIIVTNQAPTFHFDGSVEFIKRTIQTTALPKVWIEPQLLTPRFLNPDHM